MEGLIFSRFLSHGINFNSQIRIQFLIAIPVLETLQKSHFSHRTFCIRIARARQLQSNFKWLWSEIIFITYLQEHCKRKHVHEVLQFLKLKVSQLSALSVQAMLNEFALAPLNCRVITIHKLGQQAFFSATALVMDATVHDCIK